mmetsp:Transcript_20669/g.51324  ORF Transcript_20669/g.51324 Transcript_20669/m.51324 type:complete len:85 (-) Transcript_20669:98-352(-)
MIQTSTAASSNNTFAQLLVTAWTLTITSLDTRLISVVTMVYEKPGSLIDSISTTFGMKFNDIIERYFSPFLLHLRWISRYEQKH